MSNYCTDITQQQLLFNGHAYHAASLPVLRQQLANHPFGLELVNFLQQWFSPTPTISIQSSGSTGKAKTLVINKQYMLNSALMTCRYLQLTPGSQALLCLPLSYIAGKMMVVRALVAGLQLHIVPPDGHPLANNQTPYQLAAMVPMQVYNILQSSDYRQQLNHIEHLLIGGGAIADELRIKLSQLPTKCYATYGMAETVSHIAICQLDPLSSDIWFTPFTGIKLSLSAEQTLIINAPHLATETIYTRDIAQFNTNGQFKIMGRLDNVINSGGIKVQLETIEAQLRPYLDGQFAITAQQDDKFGQRIVLLCEQTHVDNTIFNHLPVYQRPKAIYCQQSLPITHSGKINRQAVMQLATELKRK